MKIYADIGIQIPQIYLPRSGIDLQRWAVIACDQHTSEADYWEEVEKYVGDAPSTFHLFMPEIYLGKPGEAERVRSAQANMRAYLQNGVLEPCEGLVYVEREVDRKTRRGLMLSLDLEKYDYHKGARSLIRATEGTILARLAPRMQIREGAALELPHILVLIDDPDCSIIEPLARAKDRLARCYDFDLMLGSGHLAGYRVDDLRLEAQAVDGLRRLADPHCFSEKYGVSGDESVLLFAMGDGNHSLATAKAVWEKMKPYTGMDHPARYALVEVENVYDPGLQFEPIHRVLFDVRDDVSAAMQRFFGQDYACFSAPDSGAVLDYIEHSSQHGGRTHQAFGVTSGGEFGVVEIKNPPANLAAGTLQVFLDQFIESGCAGSLDYVHGAGAVCKLASRDGSVGFFLPSMNKHELFKTVILDGELPRKTFSLGEAHEKRFYMECRKIE